jgi:urate oxidase
MSTKIKGSWKYVDAGNGWRGLTDKSPVSYNQLFNNVLQIALETFSGDPKTGKYSPSVQQTIYDTGMEVLKR